MNYWLSDIMTACRHTLICKSLRRYINIWTKGWMQNTKSDETMKSYANRYTHTIPNVQSCPHISFQTDTGKSICVIPNRKFVRCRTFNDWANNDTLSSVLVWVRVRLCVCRPLHSTKDSHLWHPLSVKARLLTLFLAADYSGKILFQDKLAHKKQWIKFLYLHQTCPDSKEEYFTFCSQPTK